MGPVHGYISKYRQALFMPKRIRTACLIPVILFFLSPQTFVDQQRNKASIVIA